MRMLKRVLWLLAAIAAMAGLFYLRGQWMLVDRLRDLVVSLQLSLPVAVDLERFLLLVVFVSLLAAVGLLLTGLAIGARLAQIIQRHGDQTAAVQREAGYLKNQQLRDYEQLHAAAAALARRLDKQVLIQTILEVASRMTSVPQANSVVSFWALRFESDTLCFEKGLYCDETVFTRTEAAPETPPFNQVMASRKVWMASSWADGLDLIRPEKAQQFGSASGIMVVPLVIEDSVLGVLVICCHPDVVKGYDGQRAMFQVIWDQLALAQAIAIHGEMAILDRLTGVYNRAYFMKRLVEEIERANRYQLPLSLLMIDIDDFKLVNDMLGHPQGDAVLKLIAKLIKKSIRPIDLVGRYGGEEFVIMLPETGYGDDPRVAGAPIVGERIRKAVDEEFQGLQKPLNLTVSVGVALRRYPEDREMDFQELVRIADEQLYRAKAAGKNRVCVRQPEKANTP